MRDQRIPRMADLTMRPFVSGKKTTGTLETHTNGLRFTSKKHEIIDVMFSNIKHSLFQPCENEVMVLIHFHLKNPVLIGKKKTKDVQFFTEVVAPVCECTDDPWLLYMVGHRCLCRAR